MLEDRVNKEFESNKKFENKLKVIDIHNKVASSTPGGANIEKIKGRFSLHLNDKLSMPTKI